MTEIFMSIDFGFGMMRFCDVVSCLYVWFHSTFAMFIFSLLMCTVSCYRCFPPSFFLFIWQIPIYTSNTSQHQQQRTYGTGRVRSVFFRWQHLPFATICVPISNSFNLSSSAVCSSAFKFFNRFAEFFWRNAYLTNFVQNQTKYEIIFRETKNKKNAAKVSRKLMKTILSYAWYKQTNK